MYDTLATPYRPEPSLRPRIPIPTFPSSAWSNLSFDASSKETAVNPPAKLLQPARPHDQTTAHEGSLLQNALISTIARPLPESTFLSVLRPVATSRATSQGPQT